MSVSGGGGAGWLELSRGSGAKNNYCLFCAALSNMATHEAMLTRVEQGPKKN